MPESKSLKQGNAISAFLHEVAGEIRQITWPTRQEIVRLTLMVIIVSVAVGVYLGALDYLFTYAMGHII